MDIRVDQITIEAARRGDRDAQARMLRQLQDTWFRFCLGLLGSAEDARDAVQETALRFLRDLPRFRGESSISTWSMGIAINVTREMRRKMRLVSEYDETQHQDTRATAGTQRVPDPPENQVLKQESRERLRESLAILPERQREALLLRYFEDLSVEETASAMGCATGTVKATVHQALRSLRSKLTQLS